MTLRKLVEARSKRRRWSYILCAAVALWFAILSAALQDDLRGLIPYLCVVAVCLVQFFHPTLTAWLLLTAAFAAYTLIVGAKFQGPISEFAVFLLCGGLPTLALLCSWPKPSGEPEKVTPDKV